MLSFLLQKLQTQPNRFCEKHGRLPVIPDTVVSGTFVAAVGAYHSGMSELPPSLIRRASKNGSILCVDTMAGARHEAGDLITADVDWSQVRPLESLLTARPPVADIAVFKSVGSALWDLAAARVAVANCFGS